MPVTTEISNSLNAACPPPPRGIHVVHVVLTLNVGGLERVVLNLAAQGIRSGQRVTIVCLEERGVLAQEAAALGARVESVDKRPGLQLRLAGRIRRLFRELAPDVVHSHQVGALFYAGRVARAVGVPVVVHTEHGKHYATRWRTRVLGRLAARHADRFFVVSKDIADEVIGCRVSPSRNVAVVANGIDVDRFAEGNGSAVRDGLKIPLDAPLIGTVGRLSEVKRQDLLLRAFADLRRTMPTARLLLVGDGPLRDELTRLAVELGVAPYTHFAGYQSQPDHYLHAMNAFALTSRSEGMPLVVLEAFAAGVPVVASRVGGLPQLIEDGHTGLLFEPGNVPDLVVKLRGLLLDDALARRVAAAARDAANATYSVGAMGAAYARHYDELLSTTRAKARA